jgi:hypothetical protein
MVGYCFDTTAGSISRGSASSSSARTPPDNFFALPLPIGAGLAAGHPVTPEVRLPAYTVYTVTVRSALTARYAPGESRRCWPKWS